MTGRNYLYYAQQYLPRNKNKYTL